MFSFLPLCFILVIIKQAKDLPSLIIIWLKSIIYSNIQNFEWEYNFIFLSHNLLQLCGGKCLISSPQEEENCAFTYIHIFLWVLMILKRYSSQFTKKNNIWTIIYYKFCAASGFSQDAFVNFCQSFFFFYL